ncbi:hypothetical protein [Salinibacter altiplanensis]|uniref:hypothetical protein n=1 Tax=Salinibacter altiplanensis TaxID=1803181 RepID=UPI001F222B8B|nr:hypothetical protein [Salinibacter altiplanensis]
MDPLSDPQSDLQPSPGTGSSTSPQPQAARLSDGESIPSRGAFLLLLPYRSPDSIDEHPAVATWLRRGWEVASARERLVEGKGTRVLVTLHRAGEAA